MAVLLSATLFHRFAGKRRDNLFGSPLEPLGFKNSPRAVPEIRETVKQRAEYRLFSRICLFQAAMKQSETVKQHAADRTSLLALIDGGAHA
jgi:hypothetical protein